MRIPEVGITDNWELTVNGKTVDSQVCLRVQQIRFGGGGGGWGNKKKIKTDSKKKTENNAK
jgi:hypothetical protein